MPRAETGGGQRMSQPAGGTLRQTRRPVRKEQLSQRREQGWRLACAHGVGAGLPVAFGFDARKAGGDEGAVLAPVEPQRGSEQGELAGQRVAQNPGDGSPCQRRQAVAPDDRLQHRGGDARGGLDRRIPPARSRGQVYRSGVLVPARTHQHFRFEKG